MRRRCLNCKTEFEGRPESTLCPTCAAKSKVESVLRERICRQCGCTFRGGPRAWYCPSCRSVREKERAKIYRSQGFTRHLGDIDKCEICGKEYVVTSGLQRYCKDCAQIHLKKIDREQSRAWNRKNVDLQVQKQERKAASAQVKCAVCGKLFTPGLGGPVTCSPECQELYHRKQSQKWEADHREERNHYHNELLQKKTRKMTQEEYMAYRREINSRARDAYARRLAAMTPDELKAFREKRNKSCRKSKKGQGGD